MKFVDNDHLFCYNDPLQQELQLALVDEDVEFGQWNTLLNRLIELNSPSTSVIWN